MEIKQKSLKFNFIMNAMLTVSTFVFPIITFPYVSRVLTPIGTGKVSFAISLISYFSMIAQLGIPTYGIRACARVRDDREELTRTVHELLFINMVTGIVAYILFFFSLIFVQRLREEKTLFLIVSTVILFNAIGMEWLYKALEQYTYITIRAIVFKVISVVAMFALVHKQSDYVVYGFVSILALSGANILNFLHAHKYVDMKLVGRYSFKRHIKPIAMFFAMSCATTVYTNLDTVMLGFLATDTDVGYYNAAVKIKTILVSMVTSLGTVMLPRASYYVQRGEMDEFWRISKKAFSFVAVVATPLTLYFTLFAKQGIFFLSGDEYYGAVMPMQIIMPTVLFIGLTNILGIQILVPLGKEKVVLYSEIIGAVVNLVLNGMLIPQMASSGAAIGTLVAEFAVLVVQYFAVRKENIIKQVRWCNVFTALVIGVIASLWVLKLEINNFFVLVISACLFFGGYGVALLIMKEPIIMDVLKQITEPLANKLKKYK